MSAARESSDQDPDYVSPVTGDEEQRKIYEESARASTAKKITAIVEREFSREINAKEKEVLQIQEKLQKALKTLHLLRYVIVTDFYNGKKCQLPQTDARQARIHPAIKQLIGKSPRRPGFDDAIPSTSSDPRFLNGLDLPAESTPTNDCEEASTRLAPERDSVAEKRTLESEDSKPKKIPRYVPPKSNVPEASVPSRGVRHKIRKRIVVGNISKWIPPDWREDAASHKWTIYVRGSKEDSDIQDFVGKVRFFLHPSYRPNDVVEVTSSPFHLSRRGWGEFPLRVQLHFKNALNKPMDIIHHLKLDRTYTGLQTLGSETIVDVWVHVDKPALDAVEKEGTEGLSLTNSGAETEQVATHERTVTSEGKSNKDEEANTSVNIWVKKGRDEYILPVDTSEIKNEPIESFLEGCAEDENDTKNSRDHLDRIRFYVRLDHDYLVSGGAIKRESEEETSRRDGRKTENTENRESRDSPNVPRNVSEAAPSNACNKVPERLVDLKIDDTVKLNDAKHISTDDTGESMSPNFPRNNTSVDLQKSTLRPLQITIPPSFEPTIGKRVLLVKNNKLIPVEVTNPTKPKASEAPERNPISIVSKQRTVPPISRGISLLKKNIGAKKEETKVFSVKSSKSLLLNASYNIPALKIAESHDRSSFANGEREECAKRRLAESEEKSAKKIALGKDKYKIQSKKDLYEEILRDIERANVDSVEGYLRFAIRRLPIITDHSTDPDYRKLHPYCCASEREFLECNPGKQRSLEWFRAKRVHTFLKKKFFSEADSWTVKELIVWARAHGYTPVSGRTDGEGYARISTKCPESAASGKNAPETRECAKKTPETVSTCTEPVAFQKWLEGSRSNAEAEESFEEELDVVRLEETEANDRGRGQLEESRVASRVVPMEMEEKIVSVHDFVCEKARDIGVKLVPEEIVSNVAYCAAGRVLTKAVECLVEDLLRSSHARAWERCNDGCPKVITVDDVRGAITSREEFDVFTNEGLGSRSHVLATD